MTHTPGPWTAEPRHVHNDGTQDESAGLGWDVEGPPEPMLRGQFARAADAKLVAAAPDLLEASRLVLIAHIPEMTRLADGDVDLDDPALDELFPALQALHNAIAKAEGRE